MAINEAPYPSLRDPMVRWCDWVSLIWSQQLRKQIYNLSNLHTQRIAHVFLFSLTKDAILIMVSSTKSKLNQELQV